MPPHLDQPGSDELRGKVLLVVLFTVFLDMVGYGIVIPLLPLYVSRMGASALTVGLILTSFSVAQLIATPLLGRLSDRIGRRSIILVSLVGNAASMLLFAYATDKNLLWLFFASRILAGATAGNLSACQAAIADVTARTERAAAMGRLGAGIGLGIVVGPAVGGLLSDHLWLPPVAAAAMAVLDVIVTAIFMPETLKSRRRSVSLAPPVMPAVRASGFSFFSRTPSSASLAPPAPPAVTEPAPAIANTVSPAPPLSALPLPSVWVVLRERRMAAALALSFLTFMCMTNIQVGLALLAQERMKWGPKQVSYIFVLFGLCGLIIQGGLIGRLAKRFGEIHLVIVGAALNVAGMLLIGFARTAPTLISGLILFGVGIAVTNPSLASIASRLARDEQQGAILGFAQSAGTLGRTIGPTWGGFLFRTFGSTAPFMSGAIAAVFSLIIGLSVRASIAAISAEPRPPPPDPK
jgi:MFS family permease